MIRSLCKNSYFPKQTPDHRHDIRKGGFGFGIPFGASDLNAMTSGMLSEDQANDAEQTQQARRRPQHRPGHMLARRFKAQVFPHFLERGLNGPTGREPTDDLRQRQRRVGGVNARTTQRCPQRNTTWLRAERTAS